LYKIVLFPTYFRGTMFLFLTPCACCQKIFLKYRRNLSRLRVQRYGLFLIPAKSF